MKNFTFKAIKPTGKYKSFRSYHEIKLDGLVVGNIDNSAPYRISLMVVKKDILEDGNENCSWKWILLARAFDSIEEAKEFVNQVFERINQKYNLHKIAK